MINMGLNPGTKFYAQLVSLNQHAFFPYREIMAHGKSIPPPSLVPSFQPTQAGLFQLYDRLKFSISFIRKIVWESKTYEKRL